MTYQQIVRAKQAIDEISKMSFPIRISYQLFKIRKRIDELFEFEVGQEKMLVEKYNGSIQDNGGILFDSKDISEAFSKEVKALLETEVDEEVEPVEIDTDKVEDISIAPELMLKLDGFVNFL